LEKKHSELKKEEKEEDEEEEEEKKPTDVSYLKGQKGIPDFWIRAMKSNPLIWDSAKEKDKEILGAVKHIQT